MDCGMRCYHNIKTNKLLFFPADLELDDDYAIEFFEDVLNELEKTLTIITKLKSPKVVNPLESLKNLQTLLKSMKSLELNCKRP
ncbi:hypothetical protein FFWV33_01405 [Flavobacterium faecale]|uniref:Uncharacterized protein n=1 Tax=Flavobacterium faecale TaxID=1355330 RepID=A0A2S1L970_9FLAO|nr:hypothetical protein FFWV33_01405 [Flavobacterium faecale]